MAALSEQPEFSVYLRTIIAAISDKPEHCVIDAVALGAWGRPRATYDVDLLVLSDARDEDRLASSLRPHGFEIDRDWQTHNPLESGRVLRFRHSGFPAYPLDLIFPVDAHDHETLLRRQRVSFMDLSLWVCTSEDLILLKLKAGRPRDFDDAASVLKNPHVRVDLPYMRTWADRLGLRDELHYLLQETQT